MFNFVMGVVVGAAFSPFWMKLWEMFKETAVYAKIVAKLNQPK